MLAIALGSKDHCFGVVPMIVSLSPTCGDLSGFLQEIGVYSIYSSKMVGNFPKVLTKSSLWGR